MYQQYQQPPTLDFSELSPEHVQALEQTRLLQAIKEYNQLKNPLKALERLDGVAKASDAILAAPEFDSDVTLREAVGAVKAAVGHAESYIRGTSWRDDEPSGASSRDNLVNENRDAAKEFNRFYETHIRVHPK